MGWVKTTNGWEEHTTMVVICHVWRRWGTQGKHHRYSSMLTLLHKAKLVPMGSM